MDPLALVRSPTTSTEVSCWNGTEAYSDASPGSGRGCRTAGVRSRTAATTVLMCSGVVPQQPPTSRSPYSRTNPASASASSSGLSGYSAPCGPRVGSPALGITDSGIRACLLSVRRCSDISAGPVAQFSPITSMPSGSSAVSAAPISLPSSIVPVVSTVTWVISGIRRPSSAIARLTPSTAALTCSRSWQVSTTNASAPPASSPRPHSV